MKSAPRMDVVKREAKEDKLREFISAHLTTLAPATVVHPWLLIARSSQSPVVKALNALAPELSKAQISIRTILALLEGETADCQTDTMVLSTTECRVARNPRLLEAHEQLVLGPVTCWVGDSMRREPDKRDAYECYAADHAITAQWSTIAFNRLWAAADAIVPRQAPTVDAPAADEPTASAADLPTDLPPVTDAPVTTALTRH
jgi:hypothetical protein